MESCGAELAESAVVPEQLARLMQHVAKNLEAHADWVGTDAEAARLEREALLGVAESYRAIARAAFSTADLMRGLADLPNAPHDPNKWDRQAFARWMREKIALQRAVAQLLLDHAEASERVLNEA
ncbi:MAG TPA: hypothetical protein VFU02_17555 [Polyangiaceae bacterium]|nr:hypothetical protein [Polyangiaceae bacterium]